MVQRGSIARGPEWWTASPGTSTDICWRCTVMAPTRVPASRGDRTAASARPSQGEVQQRACACWTFISQSRRERSARGQRAKGGVWSSARGAPFSFLCSGRDDSRVGGLSNGGACCRARTDLHRAWLVSPSFHLSCTPSSTPKAHTQNSPAGDFPYYTQTH